MGLTKELFQDLKDAEYREDRKNRIQEFEDFLCETEGICKPTMVNMITTIKEEEQKYSPMEIIAREMFEKGYEPEVICQKLNLKAIRLMEITGNSFED